MRRATARLPSPLTPATASTAPAPNSLSFPAGSPALVLVIGWDGSTTLHMVRGMTKAQPTGFYDTVTVSWTDSGVSWYGDDEEIQMNENAREYHVVTLLACD